MNNLQNFLHPFLYRTVVVSVDENNKPTKTIEKKRSKVLLWVLLVLAIFVVSFLFIEMPRNILFDQIGVIFGQMF